ncbi:Lrp/AsnC family transcriptional regulator [Mycetocola sp.]|uniref:Lrp/AsnC family transcriptional regulator n=1 Tax=Mycetocola sp. TaxID=1871042 RepID=UPI003989C27D
MQNPLADEVDLRLLHLLQIAPRISWTAAGEILGLSAGAAAARWSKLRDAGLAWIAVYPNVAVPGQVTAFIDVYCTAQKRRDVAAALCQDPRVVSIDECARGRDLILTVVSPDLSTLSSFVLDEIRDMDGVTETGTSLVTAIHAEGAAWRLDALDAEQKRRAQAANDAPRVPTPAPPIEEIWPLLQELVRDPRISIAELARITDRNPATVRRHVAQLLGSGTITLRCNTAPPVSGWPIECSWLTRVPPAALTRSVEALRSLPQLRMCMSVTGESNLIFTTYSRELGDVATFAERLGVVLPSIQLQETLVHMRSLKRMGWLLRPDGRATGEIVVPNPRYLPA